MNDLLVDHVSFSQLRQVEQCPYAAYLLKTLDIEPVENGFAQAGTLAHQILAMWAKGQANISDLPEIWSHEFSKRVTVPFPAFLAVKGYEQKLFNSVLTYFQGFKGFPGFDVIGAEKEFTSSLAGERFTGIVDLILCNKDTGKLMLVDHKSSSLSSFRRDRDAMYRQLLLYSKYCADTYGQFPEVLYFNLFKENTFDQKTFAPEEYVSARIWAEEQITRMKDMDLSDWLETRPDLFRCTALCSCRHECPFGDPNNHERKKKTNESKRAIAVA